MTGVKVTDVQAMVENHLKDMILKTFDPKKADTIFTEEGEVNLIFLLEALFVSLMGKYACPILAMLSLHYSSALWIKI